ncbi:MAG: multidrug transporter [Gammaproteobacteria bacterium]
MLHNAFKKIGAYLIGACLCTSASLTPSQVTAEQMGRQQGPGHVPRGGYEAEPGAGDLIVDGLVVRPAAIGTALVGTALFLVTLPFSLITGGTPTAAEKLVADPTAAIFRRCFGCVRQGYTREYRR